MFKSVRWQLLVIAGACLVAAIVVISMVRGAYVRHLAHQQAMRLGMDRAAEWAAPIVTPAAPPVDVKQVYDYKATLDEKPVVAPPPVAAKQPTRSGYRPYCDGWPDCSFMGD